MPIEPTFSIDKERRIKYMGYWDFKNDTDKTCFEHLGDYIPQSIQEEAKEELRRRGYSEETIRREEYKRTK